MNIVPVPLQLTHNCSMGSSLYTRNSNAKDIRGESRTAAASKMEHFVIILNGQKPLTVITKSSILDVAAVLDPSLITQIYFNYNPLQADVLFLYLPEHIKKPSTLHCKSMDWFLYDRDLVHSTSWKFSISWKFDLYFVYIFIADWSVLTKFCSSDPSFNRNTQTYLYLKSETTAQLCDYSFIYTIYKFRYMVSVGNLH